jgi:hypothetical protein
VSLPIGFRSGKYLMKDEVDGIGVGEVEGLMTLPLVGWFDP